MKQSEYIPISVRENIEWKEGAIFADYMERHFPNFELDLSEKNFWGIECKIHEKYIMGITKDEFCLFKNFSQFEDIIVIPIDIFMSNMTGILSSVNYFIKNNIGTTT